MNILIPQEIDKERHGFRKDYSIYIHPIIKWVSSLVKNKLKTTKGVQFVCKHKSASNSRHKKRSLFKINVVMW